MRATCNSSAASAWTVFSPSSTDLRVEGTGMTLRYPEGLTSGVNANLALTGPLASPLLSGRVDVYHANYSMRVDPTLGYLGLVAGGTGTGDPGVGLPAAPSETPIALDIRLNSDILPFIQSNNATISGSADVDIAGTIPPDRDRAHGARPRRLGLRREPLPAAERVD